MTTKENAIAVKTLATWSATLIACLGLVSVLHARYVIPTILNDARDIMHAELEEHSEHTHEGALTMAEFTIWAASIQRQLDHLVVMVEGR